MLNRGLVLVGAFANVACAHQAAQRTYTAGDSMIPTIAGTVAGAGVPVLPKGADALEPALATCRAALLE